MQGRLTIRELKKAYADGTLSAGRVWSECLDKARRLDEELGLFISLFEEREPGPGAIPAGAADNLCLQGSRTTCGSRIMEGYHSPFSAFALEKAGTAGFEILGKTNIEEFGIGDRSGISPLKTTRNPWQPDRQGGSGAAAAVATGVMMAAFASDAGCGLRQEASYTGVVGLKPSYGRVSRRGLIDYASSLDQVGVLARCVEDAAYGLAGISGRDPREPTSWKEPLPSGGWEAREGYTFACPREWLEAEDLEDGVRQVFGQALEEIQKKGIGIKEVSLPALKGASLAAAIIGSVEAFSNLANHDGVRFGSRTSGEHLQDMYIQTRSAGFGFRVKEYLTFGALFSSGKYYQDYFLWAQRYRRNLLEEVNALLKETPLMILPTTPFTPPLLSEASRGPKPRGDWYTSLANLAGLPALSLPAGIHGSLPVGLQLIGRPFEEEYLLRAATLVEEITAFPGLAPDVREG